ncbi:MAG: beta-lactamase family protein [Clostridia bacterium]|nr:beta-lactamase family protein [Clostridia bacterium]
MAKRTICFIITLLLTAALCLSASAEEVPLTVSYENKDNIKSALNELIDKNYNFTPSVSITVFDDKQDICTISYGCADIEANIEADENTVYEWGSVSKLLVWTSAMQLYEQGKLDLNEDIRNYLPKGFLNNLSYKDAITMTELMNHTAGFQETTAEIETKNLSDILPLDKALKTTAPAQAARPGETVSYSNWGASLAGYVVSCISGMDYADYVKENIFDKLGMEHTYIRPDASDNEWAAEQRHLLHSYIPDYIMDTVTDLGECRTYINLYPAGSAGGTISDMAKFAKAFLCDSKNCPLFEKDDTLDIMLSPSFTFGDGSPRICHGMFYTLYGDGLYGHGGNTSACSSDLELDLKNKTGYVMMINSPGDHIYSYKLPELLYGYKEIPAQSNFERVDISGNYKMGRSSCGAGMLKIAGVFEDAMKVFDNGGYYSSSNGITKLTQITDTFFEAELPNGKKRYYAVKKDSNGNAAALESYQAIDFIKISDAQFYTERIMVILLLVSICIPAVLFFVYLIRLKKYKDTDLKKFKTTQLLAALMKVLILAEAIAIGLTLGIILNGGKLLLALAAIILCALAIAEFALCLRCRFYKNEQKPDKTILLNIETVCSIITIVCIVYWRLFQWWGF